MKGVTTKLQRRARDKFGIQTWTFEVEAKSQSLACRTRIALATARLQPRLLRQSFFHANDTESIRVGSVTDARSAELLVIRLPGMDQTLKDLEFRLGGDKAMPSA